MNALSLLNSLIARFSSSHVNDDIITTVTPMDMSEAVNFLVDKGFELSASMKAIVKAEYDIHTAIQYLTNKSKSAFRDPPANNTTSCTSPPTSNTQLLMDKDYTKSQAISALEFCDDDVDKAADMLLKGEFCAAVQQCNKVLRLSSILKQYIKNNTQNYDIQIVLNDFNHLLFYHSSDVDFEYIYNLIGKCDVKKCDLMKRHYRVSNGDNDDDNKDNKVDLVQTQLMNKIHCHFAHCYDIGFRLTSKERKKLDQDDFKGDDKNSKILNAANTILKSKRELFSTFTNSSSLNKFCQMEKPNDYQNYSFGQNFYYWNCFKNCQDHDPSDIRYKYSHWYVPPKYKTLKFELMNNDIATIDSDEWNEIYEKAVKYITTDYAKTLLSELETEAEYLATNTSKYGVPDNTQLTLNHLISIILYCGYSNLSYKFSQTFRRADNTGDKLKKHSSHDAAILRLKNDFLFKQRHCNFHHFSKNIHEAVQIFSKQAIEMKTVSFYHGISKQMIFDSMECAMYQPFSTTGAWEVALHFSNKTGMIVQLKCPVDVRYFDCAWISDFSNERELLFISTFASLTIVNITNTLDCVDYTSYIKAISIIDCMTSSNYFESDNQEICRKIYIDAYTKDQPSSSWDPKSYGAKEIDPVLKLLTIKLIKHELSRCKPRKYEKLTDINLYIECLLHNVCIKKKRFFLDWNAMTVEISKEYEGGYQGYLFLKCLLCETEYDMIKLEMICDLFPNLTMIKVMQMPCISKRCLDYILKYVIDKKLIIFLQLDEGLIKEKKILNNLSQLMIQYKQQFQDKGWKIAIKGGGRIYLVNMQIKNLQYMY